MQGNGLLSLDELCCLLDALFILSRGAVLPLKDPSEFSSA
jgi:hypothetical protein